MGLLKFIAVGAAIGYGINYITKKGPDGRSILDDITDDAPEWFDKAKKFAEEKVEQVVTSSQSKGGYTETL
ncbi:YtxH domain-containing protein [Mucilaginibacter sp. ZT4R22]|uniref:YtxH domain-containing protein n=1 Tax=Mucilaginibacter pankratovii TaxID=2772110 RepID=A0ABR7WZ73_9SPHI|nr:YtxH domain-containing protein [Mucilaginibacter pankratovii]MBD1366937.1 YtxH domain-containing protein [Mucilaginibacter pankratovii]